MRRLLALKKTVGLKKNLICATVRMPDHVSSEGCSSVVTGLYLQGIAKSILESQHNLPLSTN